MGATRYLMTLAVMQTVTSVPGPPKTCLASTAWATVSRPIRGIMAWTAGEHFYKCTFVFIE